MTSHDLIALLNEARVFPSDRLMVKELESGKMFSITGLTKEIHDDADGSTTVWIEVSEF